METWTEHQNAVLGEFVNLSEPLVSACETGTVMLEGTK